jgi:myo-inositol-1(or 4)-monophosphatase
VTDNSPPLPPDPRATTLFEALHEAGEACLARFGNAAARHKDDGSRVTDADLASEAILLEAIRRHFPDDGIHSEEAGHAVRGTSGATWYVDPLDGTDAYVEGLAHWGPTIGRVVDGRVEQGALYLPRLGEFWFAAQGAGAWLGDRRLAPVDPPEGDRNAVLYLPSRAHQIGPLPWPGKVRALGSTAVHLALVASGAAAGTVVTRWSPWDVAAGILLVQETGRQLLRLDGVRAAPDRSVPMPFAACATSAVTELQRTIDAALEHAGRR